MSSHLRSGIWAKVFSVITEALGCFGLYYGAVMLLLVPRDPAENYFVSGRVTYGVVPVVLSVGLFILAGWLWSQAGGPATLGTYVKRAFLGAVGVVVLFGVGLIVVAHLQGRIP